MRYRFLGFVFALASSAPAICLSAELRADCHSPNTPNVPDGATASEDELIATQTSVKQFNAEAESYLECLKKAETALGKDITEEQRKQVIALYNAMVDQMHGTAEAFNAAVRAFKARAK